jgi:HD-like signal output (HDOD) protein
MEIAASRVQRFFPDNLVLPTMPEVATKLLRTFGDENANLDTLVDLIGKDAALAAKVLRLANSARYSAKNVANLRDAAAVLGTTTLRNLAMAACVTAAFPSTQGLDRKRFWRHGIASAHYAVLLARALNLDSETAYLAGLMLRTGQLLMAMQAAKEVVEVETRVEQPGSRFGWEAPSFECAHSDVTAELARRWKFPTTLVHAFESAADPMEATPFSALGAALHMAEVLADALDLEEPPGASLQAAVPELVEHLRLDLQWLDEKQLSPQELAQEVEMMG